MGSLLGQCDFNYRSGGGNVCEKSDVAVSDTGVFFGQCDKTSFFQSDGYRGGDAGCSEYC